MGREGTFWGDENVLYLDGGVDYVDICILKKLISLYLCMLTLYLNFKK